MYVLVHLNINLNILCMKTEMHYRSVCGTFPYANSLSMVYGSQAPRTTCHFHKNWVLCGFLSGLYFSRKLRTKNSLSLVPVCSVDSPTRVQKVAGCPSFDCYFFQTAVGRLENIILPAES